MGSRKVREKVFFLWTGLQCKRLWAGFLASKQATLAVAESCTGGLISHLLTNVPGSSGYFLFSGVTYSNEAKTKVLGVSSQVLKQYGAVHQETVKKMAQGVRGVLPEQLTAWQPAVLQDRAEERTKNLWARFVSVLPPHMI